VEDSRAFPEIDIQGFGFNRPTRIERVFRADASDGSDFGSAEIVGNGWASGRWNDANCNRVIGSAIGKTRRQVDQNVVQRQSRALKYKDGEKKIIVPASAPIVTYVPGDKSDIKPGAKVFIVAVKQADGTLLGRAWRIGRDGVTPPM
jgi:hypothetical protein